MSDTMGHGERRPSWARTLVQNRSAAFGLCVLGIFVVASLLGPWLLGDPTASTGGRHEPPSAAHWFGTTAQGQDVFAQTIAGARLSLLIGFTVGALALVISMVVGVTAGYFGGVVDDVLSLATNVFLVIPGLPLAIVLASFLPPGPIGITAVLTVTGWAWNARVLRSQTLALRGKDYVAAARVMGESPARIIWSEILPNMRSLLVSCFIGATIYAIGAQVGLEYLGLGDPGLVSWGTNLYWATNDAALITGAWWTFVPSGCGLALVAFALTLVNFGIDELTNPRLTAEREQKKVTGLARRAQRLESSSEALLSIQSLRVEYVTRAARVVAVKDVSLEIRRGEIFGLAGESGCGKSTLAASILRILRPPATVTGGEIFFEGRPVLSLSPGALAAYRWRDAAMVFQSAMDALNPVLKIKDQIIDTIQAHEAVSGREARRRAGELLELVRLAPGVADQYPHTLSGGMRQRVVIAIALALRPKLLIMDEPTTALDVVVERQILRELEHLKDELDFSVLFITHDLPLMLDFADRIGVMYAGELVEVAEVAELRARPRHPYTEGLLRAFPSITGPKEVLAEIPGAPPSLKDPPAGCRFHPRCAFARSECSAKGPELRGLDRDHAVACFFPVSVAHPAPAIES